MLLKLLCLFLLLKTAQARYGFVPKFYGQDSAVIVDTDKPLPPSNNVPLNYPTKLRLAPPFPMWQHFPRYRIIPPPPPGQILAINTWAKNYGRSTGQQTTTSTSSSTTTTSTTTTTTPPPTTTSTTTTPRPTTSTTTTTPPPTTTKASQSSILQSSLKPSKFDIDTVPFVTDDEFPKELLDIAQNKLGLKSLDEIPSISELGQLLGTNTPQETLNYLEQLTSNDQGVALMKAYIESTDYTDSSGGLNDKQNDSEDYNDDEDNFALLNKSDTKEPFKINDEGLVVISDEDSNDDYETEEDGDDSLKQETLQERKTPKIVSKPKTPGLFERIANYVHLNNLWHHKEENKLIEKSKEQQKAHTTSEPDELNRVTFLGKKSETTNDSILNKAVNKQDLEKHVPTLVRDPIPYNYPVPIRPSTATTPTSTTTTITPVIDDTLHPTSVHLNTPKLFIPPHHIQQLARVTNIAPNKIEDFLSTKPKLLAMANKVSRFPIGYDRNSPMEAQIMKAVQKAIEQDDDLKKLLNSTATLK